MPSRKPAKPVVVDGITWFGVLRTDRGHVTFQQAVDVLRGHGEQFDRRDLEPAFFKALDNGNFKPCRSTNRRAFVGWILK